MVDVPKSAQTEFRVGYVTGLKYDATGEFLQNRIDELCIGWWFQQPAEYESA